MKETSFLAGKTFTLLAVTSVAVCSAHGAAKNWALSDADPANVVTNAVHFSGFDAESPANQLNFLASGSDLSLTMPAETDYTGSITPIFYVFPGKTITYDGPGKWRQADLAADAAVKYPKNQHLMFSGNWKTFWTRATDDFYTSRGEFLFDNLKFRLSQAEDGAIDMDFDRGLYNTYDPNGTADNSVGDGFGSGATADVIPSIRVAAHAGSTLRTGPILVYGSSGTNEFTFDGGADHYIRRFRINDYKGGGDDPVPDRTQLLVTGPETRLTLGSFDYSWNGDVYGHRYRVDIQNGGELVVTDEIKQTGRSAADRFHVSGGGTLTLGTATTGGTWTQPAATIAGGNLNGSMTLVGGALVADGAATVLRGASFSGGDHLFTGGSFSVDGTMLTLNDGTEASRLTFDGTEVDIRSYLFQANAADAISEITFTNANVRFCTSDEVAIIGSQGTGTLNITAGTRFGCATTVRVGGKGDGTLNVTGGAVELNNLTLVTDAADGSYCTFALSGGTVQVSNDVVAVASSSSSGSTADLVLDGGVLTAPALRAGSGAATVNAEKSGTARLYANGGTFCPSAASSALIANFALAALGADGLTVSSVYDVTIPQSFSDEDGAEGVLTLTGAGTKTLSGPATTVSRIVVAGGTVVFAEGVRASSALVVKNGAKVIFEEDPSVIGFTALTVGDGEGAGTLVFSPGQTLAIDGEVALEDVLIELDGDFTIGSLSTLITAAGSLSDGSAAVWTEALVSSGMLEGAGYTFEVTTENGVTTFGMNVAESDLRITLLSGTSNGVDAVSYPAGNRLVVEVAALADLTLSGALSRGGLDKKGDGRLVLSNDGNQFRSGIASQAGVLSASSVAALGWDGSAVAGFTLKGGTFAYTGEAATYPGPFTVAADGDTAPVMILNEGDLTLTDAKAVKGAAIKRGAGRLTFAPAAGASVSLSAGRGSINNSGDPSDSTPFAFPEGDLPPSKGFGGFTVAEGEVRLAGDLATRIDIPHTVLVGTAATDEMSGRPVLTVDGVKADIGTAGSQDRILLGSYAAATAGEGRFPRLEILNGAEVTTRSLVAGRNLANNAYNWPTTVVDRAKLNITGTLCAGWHTRSRPVYVFRDGATVFANAVQQYGPADFELSDSVFKQNAAGGCLEAKFSDYWAGVWNVRSGAEIHVGSFSFAHALSASRRLQLNFHGGTWYTGDGARDTFSFAHATNLVVTTFPDGGLTLPVAAGKTVRVACPIAGEGGVVKTGAGTLVFDTRETKTVDGTSVVKLDDPVTLAFEGELDVREGSVSVVSGACRAGGVYRTAAGAAVDFGGSAIADAVLTGAGGFSDLTLDGGIIRVELADDGTAAEAPTLSAAAFTGGVTVDFNRAGRPGPDRFRKVTVARFDAAVSIAGWRAKNVGKGCGAVLSVEGNEIVATVQSKGTVIVVR